LCCRVDDPPCPGAVTTDDEHHRVLGFVNKPWYVFRTGVLAVRRKGLGFDFTCVIGWRESKRSIPVNCLQGYGCHGNQEREQGNANRE
jgi:hypothetical protein